MNFNDCRYHIHHSGWKYFIIQLLNMLCSSIAFKWEIILYDVLCKDISLHMFIYARKWSLAIYFLKNKYKMLHIMKISADYPAYENSCQYIHFRRKNLITILFHFIFLLRERIACRFRFIFSIGVTLYGVDQTCSVLWRWSFKSWNILLS